MTSPSRRNRRTTPSNILRRNCSSVVTLAAVLASVLSAELVFAADAKPVSRIAPPVPFIPREKLLPPIPVVQRDRLLPPVPKVEIRQVQYEEEIPLLLFEDPKKKPMKAKPKKKDTETFVDPLRRIIDIHPYEKYLPEDLEISKRSPEEKTFWKEEKPRMRHFESALFTWDASNQFHNPLYFEDPQLERYGQTYCEAVQPFVSAARFGVQLVGLPYQTAIDPICKKVYPLGWYRPGDCAPQLFYQIPWNAEAAGVEAGVMTGLFFLIP